MDKEQKEQMEKIWKEQNEKRWKEKIERIRKGLPAEPEEPEEEPWDPRPSTGKPDPWIPVYILLALAGIAICFKLLNSLGSLIWNLIF